MTKISGWISWVNKGPVFQDLKKEEMWSKLLDAKEKEVSVRT